MTRLHLPQTVKMRLYAYSFDGVFMVSATGGSLLPYGRNLFGPSTENKEGSKEATVLRVKPTPARLIISILGQSGCGKSLRHVEEEEKKLALFMKKIINFPQMIRCKEVLLRKDWRIINLLLVSGLQEDGPGPSLAQYSIDHAANRQVICSYFNSHGSDRLWH